MPQVRKSRSRDEGGNFGPSAKETPQTKSGGVPSSAADEKLRKKLGMAKTDFKRYLASGRKLSGGGGMKSPPAPKGRGK